MKTMAQMVTKQANGGSVRCSSCGWTTWGVSDCKSHIKKYHRRGSYVWYQWGPYNRYTKVSEHGGWKKYGSV